MLPGAGEAAALAAAEHVRLLVRREFEGLGCPVSVPVGVASRGPEARDAGELMRAANRALFAAKRLGRDHCVVHHEQTLQMLDALRDCRGRRRGGGRWRPRCCSPRRSTCATSPPPATRRPSGATRSRSRASSGSRRRRSSACAPRASSTTSASSGSPTRSCTSPGSSTPASGRRSSAIPELGSRILEHGNLRDISAWVLHHHERIDGGGYPQGLAGEAIPVEARILAVADAYEAMTADRPYRRGAPARRRARGAAPRRRHPVRPRRGRGLRARARPRAARLRGHAGRDRARRRARRARRSVLTPR